MRRNRGLIAGIVCGLVCMLGVTLYIHEANAELEEERAEVLERYGGEQVEVYVASKDIAAGDTVSAANVEKTLWVGELLPDGAITDLSEVEGLTLTSTVYEGEVLIEQRFEGASEQTLQVPEGQCAVSVPAKPVSAVGGSVVPGDTVNVYATSGLSTDLIATDVTVLATSTSSTDDESDEVTWITLAVEPSLVTELIAAANQSELYFTLPAEGLDLSSVASATQEDNEEEDAATAADASTSTADADEDDAAEEDTENAEE